MCGVLEGKTWEKNIIQSKNVWSSHLGITKLSGCWWSKPSQLSSIYNLSILTILYLNILQWCFAFNGYVVEERVWFLIIILGWDILDWKKYKKADAKGIVLLGPTAMRSNNATLLNLDFHLRIIHAKNQKSRNLVNGNLKISRFWSFDHIVRWPEQWNPFWFLWKGLKKETCRFLKSRVHWNINFTYFVKIKPKIFSLRSSFFKYVRSLIGFLFSYI